MIPLREVEATAAAVDEEIELEREVNCEHQQQGGAETTYKREREMSVSLLTGQSAAAQSNLERISAETKVGAAWSKDGRETT